MYARNEDNEVKIIIQITRATWKQLNDLKQPGDSFNTVIQRLLSSKEDG